MRAALPVLLVVVAHAVAIAYVESAVASLRGLEAANEVRAGPFPWPMYLAGVALAVVGLWRGLLRAQEAAWAPSSSGRR